MAKYGPVSCFLLVGGNDVTGDHFKLEDTEEGLLEQSNALGDSMEEHLPIGLAKFMLKADGGIYDDRTFAMLASLEKEALTPSSTPQLVAYGVQGNAVATGSPAPANATLLNGTYIAKWNRIASRDELTKANSEHTITGSRLRGVILHRIVAETAASSNTEGADSVDNAALTSNGATADLHVPALTLGGYTNVTLKTRHSTDDVTYADLHTFTVVAVAGTAERQTSAGTVNRHLATSWLFNGAGSGQSITFFIALARG
jgi:hypothetical protein